MMAKPPPTLASICISCAISWVLLGLSPSNALAQTEAERVCNQAVTSADDTIASCSAVIDSGMLGGRPLAATYSRRGCARTLKRDLPEAETDLDEAIKIDPGPSKIKTPFPRSGSIAGEPAD
jgi:hypothetical protein